jgi:peptide/nickel transport system substrate-binding protein
MAVGALSAACMPAVLAPAGSTPTPTIATIAPAQPRRGGSLIVGLSSALVNTAPYPGSQFILSLALFDPLVSIGADKQPIPWLAESWRLSDDGLTLTLNLRSGVQLHSGRTFTAEDAKWSIDYARDPKNQAAAGGELRATEALVVDATTLQLKMPNAMPHVFSLLAGVMMVDQQTDPATRAIGTGPFMLDSFRSGDVVQLVRNPHYWQADRPRLDAVTIRTMPDTNSAVVALESGAAHLVQCAPSDVRRLQAGNQTRAVVLSGSGSYDFVINATSPPFADMRVRQAIDLALDRQRFAQTLMYGLTEPTYIIWMKQSPVWDVSLETGEFNLDKARQLLSDAGYANGFDTTIQSSSAYPELVRFDEIAQADLAKIGVKANIEQLEANQALALVTQAKFPALINHVYSYGDQDPAMLFTAFVLRPDGNASRFSSDEYSMLVSRAREERDWAQRVSLYRRIAMLVKKEAFLLPIANYVNSWGVHANVQGVVRLPLTGAPSLAEVWLS